MITRSPRRAWKCTTSPAPTGSMRTAGVEVEWGWEAGAAVTRVARGAVDALVPGVPVPALEAVDMTTPVSTPCADDDGGGPTDDPHAISPRHEAARSVRRAGLRTLLPVI